MSEELSIKDIQSYIRGKARHPIMTVNGIDDPDYKSMRKLVIDIKPETEDYMHGITSGMNNILSSLRHMETDDYNRIVNTFKKYEVKGTSSGISGSRTYGYDRSRIDGSLIKRKRGN
jgi:hypothetical protein